MRYSGADPKPRTLASVLDAIHIIESHLATGPGDPIPPPSESEAAILESEKYALVGSLTDYLHEINRLRIVALRRLQGEAYRRLSRAAGGRTLNRIADHLDMTGESVRIEHKTASGETVIVTLTPTAPMTAPLGADVLPCVVDGRIIYLRLTAPAALLKPATGDLSGDEILALIRLCEKIAIAPD